MNDFGLADKVAIVTGGGSLTSGIGNGRAAAVLLAEAGARVVIVDSAPEHMEETQELIRQRGGSCLTLSGDVSNVADAAAIVEQTIDKWARVDVLVNNVGIAGPAGTVVDVDLDDLDRCVRINVISVVLMSRFAIPHMRDVGGGSIVNVSSVLGLRGGHPAIGYPMTKAAVIGMTKSMAVHHAADNIRVNAVAPGFVYTPMVSSQGLTEEDRQRRRRTAPLGTEGTGWDTGEAVRFLASPLARWITGVVLPIDGGLIASIGMTSSMSVTSQTSGASADGE